MVIILLVLPPFSSFSCQADLLCNNEVTLGETTLMAQQSLITDEIRSWIGKETPPWTIEVTTLDVKRFVVATDDLNPLYLDEEQSEP